MVDEATRAAPQEDPADDARRLGAAVLRVGPFRLLERLGEGGMGVVYLAERRQPVEQRVALKVIRSDRLDRTYLLRFAMEQQALARMDHPHVARLIDAGVDDGQSWFAMEYVPGVPLDDYCTQHRLSVAERLQVFQQVCDGVQHAHQQGILHRDLKPANILVREVDGRPVAKIIDFGLAQPVDPLQVRATLHESARTIVGTFAYMSPEQAQRSEGLLDIRTDVYSLGVLLYELLTGELPIDLAEVDRRGPLMFGAYLREFEPARPSTRLSQLGQRLSSTAAERRTSPQRLRSQVRGELDWITMKALERDRQRRYATVRDLGRDVERFLRLQPVEAGPPGVGYVLRKWLRRNWPAAVAGSAIAVLLVGGGVQQVVHARETARLAAEARRAEQPLLAAGLLAQAEEFALRPEHLARLQDWLVRARALLDADLDTEGGTPALLRYFDETRPQLVRAVEAADELRLDIEWVAARTDEHAEQWQRCSEAVEQLHGMRLARQFGLLPLGPDPDSGLQEFEVIDARWRGEPEIHRETRDASGRLQLDLASSVILVLLPGGSFGMGSTEPFPPELDPDAAKAETPRHTVTLAPFFCGKYEVTIPQHCDDQDDVPNYWDIARYGARVKQRREAGEFVDAARSRLARTRDLPVSNVTWVEAERRARRLGLRLLAEAEWEYAARAGTDTPWSCASDEATLRRHANLADALGGAGIPIYAGSSIVWTGSDGVDPPGPIGAFLPNAFGLHDLHGNVREWCADEIHDYDPARPGENAGTRGKRVVRGGSATSEIEDSRSARRGFFSPFSAQNDFGYRVARSIDQ